jgi:hypothetical protein
MANLLKDELMAVARVSPQLRYSPDLSESLASMTAPTRDVLKCYFDGQPREYVEELERFAVLNKSEIKDEKRIHIFIPAFNEESNLGNIVSLYDAQSDYDGNSMHNQYDLCFVVNMPCYGNKARDGWNKGRLEKAVGLLLEYKQDRQNIHVLPKLFDARLASLGRARKYGMDYCLYLALRTEGDIDRQIIVSNEGDTMSIPSTYLAQYRAAFGRDPMRLVQGEIRYPEQLMALSPALKLFCTCREAVHHGQGIHGDDFPYFDGIMPVGRNFAVAPRICAQAGGVDTIRRDDTDDDMNFGTDIQVRLGKHAKTFLPVPLITNPRREVMIVRDILAGRDEDSRKSYENFHSRTELYDLDYAGVLSLTEQVASPVPDALRCALINQYFQWVNKSRHKANLDCCPGFSDVLKRHRGHEISYWQKEAILCGMFETHYDGLSNVARKSLERTIVGEALTWFNYFIKGTGHEFNAKVDGLESRLLS